MSLHKITGCTPLLTFSVPKSNYSSTILCFDCSLHLISLLYRRADIPAFNIINKRATMPTYVQRNMFDALDVEDVDYEEEEEVVEVDE